MLITPPAVAPYSAEKALASTFISSTPRTGSVLNSVWRPQLSVLAAPSVTNRAWRRPAPLVVNSVWFMNTSPWLMAGRLAAFNSGRLLMRRLSSGISSICRGPRRVPICGASVRTSPTVPVTVTCVWPPATLSWRLMLAVAPPASVTSLA